MREMTRSVIAGLVADGFTDREARVIFASILGRDLITMGKNSE
jgi:hypothetical protein